MTNITAPNVEETAVFMPPLGHKVEQGKPPHYWHNQAQEMMKVKKAELKAGVPYFVSTSNSYGWAYRNSVYQIHESNKSSRYYVVFAGNEPMMHYRSASQIYMSPCKEYGANCPTHKTDGERTNCYRTDYRLMDIRNEYWSVIKLLHDRRKKENTPKDIRGARLARIAKRNQEKQEEPIKADFYAVLRQITGSYCASYDRLGGFTVQEMQTITNAIKAGMPSVQAVAS